jgi:Amt family ammonium transporter
MINSGDTAWVLVSSALVLLMTPGLAFFYGGLVRSNQVLNTMKMSFVSLGIGAVLWALVGYSLAFGSGNAFIGGFEWLGLQSVTAEPNPQYGPTVPHYAFVVFQMMFAVITPALISGAIVGRMRFKAYTLFISLWMLVVYVPLAHWVWGPGGWIAGLGAVDFAGGTVVHVSAGVAALVAARFIGHRQAKARDVAEAAHNVPFVVLGASLLWFGWFGFNAGSALAADGVAALAVTTTMLSAAAAVATWMLVDIWRTGKPQITGAAIAAVVGLVAITPAAGFVTPLSAMVIGAAGAAASYVAIAIIKRSGVDDTLDVFACHGVGGVVGSILTGVFATTAVNSAGADGLLAGNVRLLIVQTVSVLAAGAFAALGTLAALMITRLATPLRVADEAESAGIDYSEHNERAYSQSWYQPVSEQHAASSHANRTPSTDGAPVRTHTILETLS